MSGESNSKDEHNFLPALRHIPDLLDGIPKGHVAVSRKEEKELRPLPLSPLASTILRYAEKELPQPTLNHSLRVYRYGMAIADDFLPQWNINHVTFFLTSLLHDIGTTQENMAKSKMSFEFFGGMLSHSLLTNSGASVDQADAAAEAIIRHQDIDDIGSGMVTRLGALLQLATLYDNAGANPSLIHADTLDTVIRAHPRLKWSSCFAHAITVECEAKPWSHTTKIGQQNFVNLIAANSLGNSRE